MAAIHAAKRAFGAPGIAPRWTQGTEEDGRTPEIVLPAQFDDLRNNVAARPPEHRLMFAVLEDAVHVYLACYGSVTVRGRRLFDEVDRWFATDDASWPFAFVVVCQVLGLDPDYLRSGLRRWRARREHDHLAGRLPSRIRRVSGSRHRIATNGRSRGAGALAR